METDNTTERVDEAPGSLSLTDVLLSATRVGAIYAVGLIVTHTTLKVMYNIAEKSSKTNE